jgi:hypothetical protein
MVLRFDQRKYKKTTKYKNNNVSQKLAGGFER